MSTMKFTDDHVWVRIEDDGTVTTGITDYAQDQLGDVVYVELPRVDQTITSGEEAAVIESVKAAGDIKLPVGGTVTEVNERLAGEPELVNSDPLGDGWFFKLEPEDATELDGLMDEDGYQEYVSGL